jgi:catalase (peroxidase I)
MISHQLVRYEYRLKPTSDANTVFNGVNRSTESTNGLASRVDLIFDLT